MAILLRELAEIIGGELDGDPEIVVSSASDIQDAADGSIVFAESDRHLDAACRCRAAAVIVHDRVGDGYSKPLVRVTNPRLAFARVLAVFAPKEGRAPGVDPSCRIGENSRIGKSPSIGPNVYIGRDTVIGDSIRVYPFAYIGDGVTIGDNAIIHPFVSLYDGVIVGDDVTIHSGAVIGADGYGYTRVGDQHYKIPQIGAVRIGDRVEIGANTTIDRAKTGVTEIGAGTKVDNLVHIAHNVKIGENCLIIAQTGISGSVEIGDRATLTGQAGVKDHVSIGSDAICAGRAGVMGNIAPGAFVSGYPARPHRDQMKVMAAEQRLPEMMRTLKDLERRVRELETRSE